jgi:DNA-binding CsgD family transcriptional regulator/Trp operon repressor
MKKQIQTVIAGTAIVVAMGTIGLGVVGSAQAQPIKSSSVTVLNTSATSSNVAQQAAGMRGGPQGQSKDVAAIASVLKLTEAELKTQVQSGKTLAQIATAQSVSVQSVINVLVAGMQAHIAEELASGEITQAQADTKLAGVTAKATERVNNLPPARGEGSRGGSKGPGKSVAAIASVLKLTEAELKTQVQSGKTLAQIAAAQSVSVQSVIDVLVADMQAHIAEELASGEITQAQADTKLAGVTAKATERVNNLRPTRGEGTRGHHNNETAPNA